VSAGSGSDSRIALLQGTKTKVKADGGPSTEVVVLQMDLPLIPAEEATKDVNEWNDDHCHHRFLRHSFYDKSSHVSDQ
jgi:hypothetical protein